MLRQSLHLLRCRPCSQKPLPPQSLVASVAPPPERARRCRCRRTPLAEPEHPPVHARRCARVHVHFFVPLWPCTADNASPSPPLGCCRLRHFSSRAPPPSSCRRCRLICRRRHFPHRFHQFRHTLPACIAACLRSAAPRAVTNRLRTDCLPCCGPGTGPLPPPRAAAELANNSNLKMASKRFVVFLSFVLLNASMAGFTLLSPNSRSY